MLEQWRRWDPRIRWCDIIMRMHPPRPTQNSLNMRVIRMRREFGMLSWHIKSKHPGSTRNQVKVLAGLTNEQIIANTTGSLTSGWPAQDLEAAEGIVPEISDHEEHFATTLRTQYPTEGDLYKNNPPTPVIGPFSNGDPHPPTPQSLTHKRRRSEQSYEAMEYWHQEGLNKKVRRSIAYKRAELAVDHVSHEFECPIPEPHPTPKCYYLMPSSYPQSPGIEARNENGLAGQPDYHSWKPVRTNTILRNDVFMGYRTNGATD